MGHAHTLVLCYKNQNNSNETQLYVFGSNHFGQLGIGRNAIEQRGQSDGTHCSTLSKSLLPVELDVGKNVRLIHTKFFTNVSQIYVRSYVLHC